MKKQAGENTVAVAAPAAANETAFSACGLEACKALGRCCGMDASGNETVNDSNSKEDSGDANLMSSNLQTIYQRIVSSHYGSLPGPFNHESRRMAGLDQGWYAPLEKPPKGAKKK
jgi:hypothetical protein